MGKLLFWIVIVIGVLFVARIAGRMAAARQAPGRRQARGTANPPAAGAPEAMVRCAHCGIHLPRSEALLQGGRTWCSQEHARLGPAAK
ncbi:PP0621 family protein [Achromobacter xylosoxidans]